MRRLLTPGAFVLIVVCSATLLVDCKQKQKSASSNTKKSSKVVTKAPAKPIQQNGSVDWKQKLGLTEREAESKLYVFLSEWYGTPYKYGSCQKTGIDCSCFVNLIYDRVYGKKIARTCNEIFQMCDMISAKEAKEGDLIFFKMGGNSITHIGLYLRKNQFIHASTMRGVMLSSLDEAYFQKVYFCAGKLKSA
jgi:lipoprotein Spr